MTAKHLAFSLFCVAGVMVLPLTALLALFCAMAGDRAPLRALQGKRRLDR